LIKDSLHYHRKLKGKIVVSSKEPLTKDNLSLAYTPGVAKVSMAIAEDKGLTGELTGRDNTVAIVTDGSAVLGLGNIGPEAALPVMEGKAAIFAEFAGINAVPICLGTQDPKKIIETVINIAPSYGGINLEDIAAPACFGILEALENKLDIPVFHDDQDGTAIVVLAGLINALRLTKRDKTAKIIISGAGAAGIAIARLLEQYGLNNYCLCDSHGTVNKQRNNLTQEKEMALSKSKAACLCASCSESLTGADVLIGVSRPDQFRAADIKKMNQNPIIFALANPVPEILPEEAKKGGARIIATGRSDYPNQINNALVFPGLFRGLLDNRVRLVTPQIKIAVAKAIAAMVKNPTPDCFIPSIFDTSLVETVTQAVKKSL
jgi:malate dehydrogenase (oxaloacetate-decarboxylating)